MKTDKIISLHILELFCQNIQKLICIQHLVKIQNQNLSRRGKPKILEGFEYHFPIMNDCYKKEERPRSN